MKEDDMVESISMINLASAVFPMPKSFPSDEEIQRRADAEASRNYENAQMEINRAFHNIAMTPKFMSATLENYVLYDNPTEREGQQKALAAARTIVDNPGLFTGVVFRGTTGTGKNHIAAGICKALAAKYKTSLIIEAGTLFTMTRDIYRYDPADIRRKLKHIDVLIIDEVKGDTANEKTRDVMETIINDRYNANRPTILMGNADKDDLVKALGDRALSRLRERGKGVVFEWQDWRGRK